MSQKSVVKTYLKFSLGSGIAMGIIFPIFATLFVSGYKSPIHFYIFVVLCVMCGIFVGGMSFFIGKKTVIKFIGKVEEQIRNISEKDGDLTNRIVVDSADIVGKTADTINAFLDKQNNLIYNISIHSDNVASSATELSASMRNISEGAETQTNTMREMQSEIEIMKNKMELVMDNVQTQAAAIEEVSSSIEEISATATETAKNSEATMELSKDSAITALQGSELIINALDSMNEVEKHVEESEKKILVLENKSEEIGEIIILISEIAEQTNLLALNAAIEAAHAGEAGKGFAVVATEIKQLSGRSKEAAVSITKILNSIRVDIGDALKSSKNGYLAVNAGMALSQKAVSKISEINEKVNDTNENITNVSKSMEEQSLAIEEIAKAMSNISLGSSNIEDLTHDELRIFIKTVEQLMEVFKLTELAAVETAEAQKASEDLANIAETLHSLISEFKIIKSKSIINSDKRR